MLTPILNRRDKKPIYMQIHDFIVEEIHQKRLDHTNPLPSVRGFAAHLGISRTTVENAYNQLLAEGYIISRQGKGYFVEKLEQLQMAQEQEEERIGVMKKSIYPYDFASEYIALDAFDFGVWKRHVNYVLNYHKEDLCAYGDLRGEPALREAIARLFYRSRGIHATAAQIVVGGGVSPLLTMLAKLFKGLNIHSICLENPGFKKAFGVFEASDMSIHPLNIDRKGADIPSLYTSGVRACYVSPSHHFPTGAIMPVSERQKILKWAAAVDGYVIEDDYNFELRFEGQPIPAMQGLDRDGRVIYLGSFSTVLAPAIRISFMVLPNKLNKYFTESEAMFPQTASKIEQLALGRFIETGDFERHVKKVRKIYTRKQQQLFGFLDTYMPKTIVPVRAKSGLQILLPIPATLDEKMVAKRCEEKGIKVDWLGRFFLDQSEKRKWAPCIVLGYRGIEEEKMEEGIRAIAGVLHNMIVN